ncbi:MAG: sigma factor-like helix-turn-helix DNA-binding protein [Actinomycetota bacterium]|nr:sigma factor-like helix-turn-helix DNA-binding protein [Actinomycetota bacterium]
MTLRVRFHPSDVEAVFERGRVVAVGRSRGNDVRVGHVRVGGVFTVSKRHIEIRWDGTRWSTWNISDKAGLLRVYEPGYEEVPLEPGRRWVPVRHRWCYSIGWPDQPFHVVCVTNDHAGPAAAGRGDEDDENEPPGEDATMEVAGTAALGLTPLEREILIAYYGDFIALPRPETLAPRSHDEVARRLGRSRDSTRKAIERANEKIGRMPGAPSIAMGRNISDEIGRWLVRTGAFDLD